MLSSNPRLVNSDLLAVLLVALMNRRVGLDRNSSVGIPVYQTMASYQVLKLFLLNRYQYYRHKECKGPFRHRSHKVMDQTYQRVHLHRRKDRLSLQAEVWFHMRYIAWQASPSR